MDAIFYKGEYRTVDYTAPSGGVEAGEIIVEGDQCFIAHTDADAGDLMALASGGGSYKVAKASGSGGDAFSMGDKVWWSGTAAEATGTSNTPLGFVDEDAAAEDAYVIVRHDTFE